MIGSSLIIPGVLYVVMSFLNNNYAISTLLFMASITSAANYAGAIVSNSLVDSYLILLQINFLFRPTLWIFHQI